HFEKAIIWSLNGESDIDEISKRLLCDNQLKVYGIYDADRRGFSFDDNTLKFPVLFLPGKTCDAPEKLVINAVEENLEEFSTKIGISCSFLEVLLTEHIHDHHDWFIELSRKVPNSVLQSLKCAAIDIWCDKNQLLCRKFVFELDNMGSTF